MGGGARARAGLGHGLVRRVSLAVVESQWFYAGGVDWLFLLKRVTAQRAPRAVARRPLGCCGLIVECTMFWIAW
jgi:hypothetical protein